MFLSVVHSALFMFCPVFGELEDELRRAFEKPSPFFVLKSNLLKNWSRPAHLLLPILKNFQHLLYFPVLFSLFPG